MVDSISVGELRKLNNINIIDIRSNDAYLMGHIDGSINIPFEKLIIKINNTLDKKKKYYIYCQKGIMSQKMCQILAYSGYDVVNILGGYNSWLNVDFNENK